MTGKSRPRKRTKGTITSGAPSTPPSSKTDSIDNGKRTSFLDLPAELRNVIYHLALVEKRSIKIFSRRQRTGVKEPNLLRASRQIRSESLPVFYGANAFVAYPRTYAQSFLDGLTRKKTAMLRKVICATSHFRSPYNSAIGTIRDIEQYGKSTLRPDVVRVMLETLLYHGVGVIDYNLRYVAKSESEIAGWQLFQREEGYSGPINT